MPDKRANRKSEIPQKPNVQLRTSDFKFSITKVGARPEETSLSARIHRVMNSCFDVQAATAIASVVLTAVLVVTTILYLRTTNNILAESRKALEESRKSREAAEKQASAAQRSASLLQQQLVEQLGLGRSVVENTVDSAIEAISYWKKRPLTDVSKAAGFPSPSNLVPANALAVVEHARRISAEAAEVLSSAFTDLGNAVNEIERIRVLGSTASQGRGSSFLEQTPSEAPAYLDSAFRNLQKAKGLVS